MSKKLNVKYFIQDTSSNWASENPKMSEGVIAYETDTNKIKLFDGEHSFSELSYVGGEGSSGGASDYSALTGKPQINSVELSGNKSLDDLGIQAKGEYATKAQGAKADTAVQPSALSAYATTEAMNSALANKADTSALSDYATTESVSSTYLSKSDATSTYATKASLSGYATTSALDGKANKSTTLNGYGITDAYTKSESDGKYATKAQGTKADTAVQPSALSAYATTASLSDYVTETELEGKNYLVESDLTGYAKTADLSNYATTASLAGYAQTSSLSTVATSGSYNDLEDKPSIPSAYTLPTASTTTLGGVKVDGTSVTIEEGTISSITAGSCCYIYGNSSVPDIHDSVGSTTLIPVGRLQNYDKDAGNKLKVGDMLIDLKGNVAKIDRVNTATMGAGPFGVDESSIFIKLQVREDDTLTTTSKEIVGAINELVTKIAALEARIETLEGTGS